MGIRSLAVIPDGNRRWALQTGNNLQTAYSTGSQKIWNLLEWALEYPSIRSLYLFVVSEDNVRRSKPEFWVIRKVVEGQLDKALSSDFFAKKRIQVEAIGELGIFGKRVQKKFLLLKKKTARFSRLRLVLCVGYSGRSEILQAVKSMAKAHKEKKISIQAINKQAFKKFLSSSTDFPELVIRTGNRQRLSNFLLYQASNARLVFLEKLWPEITRKDFGKILHAMQNEKQADDFE